MIYYLGFVTIMSVITFMAYGIDKYKAKKQFKRIRERTLLTLAFIGGALGAIVGSYVFRHKSNKLKFRLLNGLFLVLILSVGVLIYQRLY